MIVMKRMSNGEDDDDRQVLRFRMSLSNLSITPFSHLSFDDNDMNHDDDGDDDDDGGDDGEDINKDINDLDDPFQSRPAKPKVLQVLQSKPSIDRRNSLYSL